MSSQTNIIIAIVLVAVIFAVMAIYVWRFTSRMSETDQVVFGCWSGEEKNRANAAVKVGLLFWSGGKYTIVSDGFNAPVIERGKYTTAIGDKGTVVLNLNPDKLGRDIANYPQLGTARTILVTAERLDGIRILRFGNGARYVNTSCEPYMPQV